MTREAADEIERLQAVIGACERYAHRMNHDAGHALDRENALAIIRIAKQARAALSTKETPDA